MMSTLLKLSLSGYDVKPRFGAFQCEHLQQNPLFLGKNFGGTRHPYGKNEPTLDHSLHGKACWLIAYYLLVNFLYCYCCYVFNMYFYFVTFLLFLLGNYLHLM